MTETTLYRAHSKLLSQAKKVFGDSVTGAYVTTYSYPHMCNKEVIEQLDREHKKVSGKGTLSIDGLHGVIIEFVGGNQVFMSCSEWSTFAKVDINKMVKG